MIGFSFTPSDGLVQIRVNNADVHYDRFANKRVTAVTPQLMSHLSVKMLCAVNSCSQVAYRTRTSLTRPECMIPRTSNWTKQQ